MENDSKIAGKIKAQIAHRIASNKMLPKVSFLKPRVNNRLCFSKGLKGQKKDSFPDQRSGYRFALSSLWAHGHSGPHGRYYLY